MLSPEVKALILNFSFLLFVPIFTYILVELMKLRNKLDKMYKRERKVTYMMIGVTIGSIILTFLTIYILSIYMN